MRKSKVAARLRDGQPIKIAMLGHYLPPFIAYAAHEGYDAIWFENEHRVFEPRELQALFTFCHLYDIDALVRPHTRERAALYRFLEDGATGLIMPHIPDVETAHQLVQAVKFPPVGDRGIEGGGLESSFGLDELGPRRQYLADHALQETLLCIMIETPQGLSSAAAIAALDGVDMLFVGPADMGLRLDLNQISMDVVYQEIAVLCRQYSKAWGAMPQTIEDMQKLIDMGAQLFVWGKDQGILRNGLKQASAELNQVLKLDSV